MTKKEAWISFWRLLQNSGASGEPSVIPEADRFFLEFASRLSLDNGLILDLASGNGSLSKLYSAQVEARASTMISLDVAFEALQMHDRRKYLGAVTASLEALPFVPGCFDLVVSRFGVEYGGEAMWPRLGGLLAPGGALCFVLHAEGSAIYQDYRADSIAMDIVEKSDFFKAFALIASEKSYRSQECSRSDLLNLLGLYALISPDVTQGSFIAQFLTYLGSHLRRLLEVQPKIRNNEIQVWLSTCFDEWFNYSMRVDSMLKAALSKSDLLILQDELNDQNVFVDQVGELRSASRELIGYKLIAIQR